LKTAVGASLPWVRIPPCPPVYLKAITHAGSESAPDLE
jgi:hypothetical protein